MICSRLNFESLIGSCFWEQAGFLIDEYDFVLCNFKPIEVNIFNFYRRLKLKKIFTPNNIKAYIVNYKQYKFLPKKVNFFIYRISVEYFYKKLIKSRFKPDLIHAQSIFNAGFEAFIIKSKFKTPYIFTEHNQFTLREKTKFETFLTQKVIYHANKRLVVSHDKIRQFAANWYYDEFIVVGNGIDSNIFNGLDSELNTKDFVLITVGAYTPLKDHLTMFKALKIVDSLIDRTIIFKWIGSDGWGKKNIKNVKLLISKFKFNNIKIELYPLLSRDKIAFELKNSNLFLFSSISEGMPLSVLEALACGIPVCTTLCGGVDELINIENGKIVQIKNYSEMAKFIFSVYSRILVFDKDKISDEILTKYGDKVFANKMSKIYASILN